MRPKGIKLIKWPLKIIQFLMNIIWYISSSFLLKIKLIFRNNFLKFIFYHTKNMENLYLEIFRKNKFG